MRLIGFGIIGVAVAMFVLARSCDGQVGLSGMPRNVRYWPKADMGYCRREGPFAYHALIAGRGAHDLC
jgi:hypothetical protein